jgi:hypothetical protein
MPEQETPWHENLGCAFIIGICVIGWVIWTIVLGYYDTQSDKIEACNKIKSEQARAECIAGT